MALPTPPTEIQLPLPHPEAYPGEPREYARALMQRKEEIEKEIVRCPIVELTKGYVQGRFGIGRPINEWQRLRQHGASMETALVDPEGYPRGDIDVYAIRHARAALVRLYNDRDEVIRRLATALESAFQVDPSVPQPQPQSQSQSQSQSRLPASANGHRDVPETWPDRPVARVNSVAPSSPAADAGLTPGDIIYSFSGITAASEGGMQAIGAVVQRSEGQTLTLLVLRGNERKMLHLTPRAWSGRGLLGCHILPA
ncbi:hypothetical protein CcaverHIS002_0508770 [Cutaneotrichosporon cavernicola]|nr:hypothetical protein CcaverHIS002_0508770 [Cutaneotrichosporon cavernicola]